VAVSCCRVDVPAGAGPGAGGPPRAAARLPAHAPLDRANAQVALPRLAAAVRPCCLAFPCGTQPARRHACSRTTPSAACRCPARALPTPAVGGKAPVLPCPCCLARVALPVLPCPSCLARLALPVLPCPCCPRPVSAAAVLWSLDAPRRMCMCSTGEDGGVYARLAAAGDQVDRYPVHFSQQAPADNGSGGRRVCAAPATLAGSLPSGRCRQLRAWRCGCWRLGSAELVVSRV